MKRGLAILALLVVAGSAAAWWWHEPAAGAAGIDPADTALVERGDRIYAQECASCHGRDLEGQTPNWRTRLPDGSIPAPPHDATGHTWHHPDQQLFEVTKYGRYKASGGRMSSNMPGFENKLSDEDIRAVLSFIKSRWPPGVRARNDQINRRARGTR